MLGRDAPGEYPPAPLVDHLAERQKRDLVQSQFHLAIDHRFIVLLGRSDQSHAVQIFRRQRQHRGVADGLVETVVGTTLKQRRQSVVGQVVIDMAELVIDRRQINFGRRDAHFDAHVAGIVHVPGAGVADHIAVPRLNELGVVPERPGQLRHAQRDVEIFGTVRHFLGIDEIGTTADLPLFGLADRARSLQLCRVVPIPSLLQSAVDIEAGDARVRLDEIVNIAPLLRPHIAGQVRRNHFSDGTLFAILVLELAAYVAMQLVVERLDLRPQPVGFDRKLGRTHVVAGAPHLACVGKTNFFGALVDQASKLLVVAAHSARLIVPALPGVELRVVALVFSQHLGQLAEIAALIAGLAVAAIFASAVVAFELARQRGHPRQLERILGRWHRGR